MRSGRSIPFAIAALLFATTAWAEDGDSSSGAKPRWEAGGRLYFVTANPLLDYNYEEHESVNGLIAGATMQRRSNDGKTRMILGLDYTTTSPKDGAWLAQGDDPPEAEWTEFEDFSIVGVNVMFTHVLTRGPFGFTFGGGLGVSNVRGTITTWPVDAAGRKDASQAPDEKDIPAFTPVILLKMGPQFEIGKMATVNLDVGFHHGFFAGTAVSFNLPM